MSTTKMDRASAERRRSALRGASATALLVAGSVVLAGGALAQDAAFAVNDDTPVDEDAGIRVPEGFDAQIFAEGVGRARHIAVRDNGDVYVALREPNEGGGIAALRDEDGDGTADTIEYFGEHSGTGIAIRDAFLYTSSDTTIYRYPLPEDTLVPQGERETVVEGFPEQDSHASKAFAFDDAGNLYVNVGAPSNACQEEHAGLAGHGALPAARESCRALAVRRRCDRPEL